MRFLKTVALAIAIGLSIPYAHASAQFLKKPIQRPVGIPFFDAQNLPDIAMTFFTERGYEIYVNFGLLNTLTRSFAEFWLVHEEGHVYLAHTWKQPNVAAKEEDDSGGQLHYYETAEELARRHQMELDADCYAAYVLSDSLPRAIYEAIEFFVIREPALPTHPHPFVRAKHLKDCINEAFQQDPEALTRKFK